MRGLPPERCLSAEAAIGRIRNGDRVFIASASAEPRHLVDALLAAWRRFADVEVLHIFPSGATPFVAEPLRDHFRYNTFCSGDVAAPAVLAGLADYTPMHLSELPRLLRTRRYPIDVALVSVTPPDAAGRLNLGLAVDVSREAVAGARYVVAQVNDALPPTRGATHIAMDDVDAFVVHSAPPPEVAAPPTDWIGPAVARFVAELIEDGDVLHIAHDPLSYAVLPFLADRRDLGLHTDIFTDPLMELHLRGVVTNARKTIDPGRTIASLVQGSRRLYDFVRDNPAVELHPTSVVHDVGRMARHPRMIAIGSARQADLTGNVLLAQDGTPTSRGFGRDAEFLLGAAASERGFPVLMMTATDPDTGQSNIVSSFERWSGAMLGRANVHYLCTEYGIAHLHAKTLRERVLALIAVAHPRHRERLMAEAKALGCVPQDQMVTPYPGCLYPNEQVSRRRFGDAEVFFRPIHPSDERGIQRFFYSHSPETVFHRYHGTIKTMPHGKVQQLTNIDYRRDVCLIGLVGERGERRVICSARCLGYGGGRAEASLSIAEDWQGRGLGTFLLRHLTETVRRRGLTLLTAQILHSNRVALRLFTKGWPTAHRYLEGAIYTFELDVSTYDAGQPTSEIA